MPLGSNLCRGCGVRPGSARSTTRRPLCEEGNQHIPLPSIVVHHKSFHPKLSAPWVWVSPHCPRVLAGRTCVLFSHLHCPSHIACLMSLWDFRGPQNRGGISRGTLALGAGTGCPKASLIELVVKVCLGLLQEMNCTPCLDLSLTSRALHMFSVQAALMCDAERD